MIKYFKTKNDNSGLAIFEDQHLIDIYSQNDEWVEIAKEEYDKLNTVEIEKQQKQNHIEELKQKLRVTDYQAIKYAEGLIDEINYESIKVQRQAWRDEINQLENK